MQFAKNVNGAEKAQDELCPLLAFTVDLCLLLSTVCVVTG